MADPVAFETPKDWHDWLAKHGDAKEVWVLYHKKGSGTPSIDWEQAVIEALVHGWIDGVRKTVDESRWMQRFTPRKPGSGWSAKNIGLAEKLIAEGRMTAAGLRQFETAKADGRFERGYSGGKGAVVPEDFLSALKHAPKAAQEGFAALDTKSRYVIYYRLTTAKRPETRAKRIRDFIGKLADGQKQLP